MQFYIIIRNQSYSLAKHAYLRVDDQFVAIPAFLGRRVLVRYILVHASWARAAQKTGILLNIYLNMLPPPSKFISNLGRNTPSVLSKLGLTFNGSESSANCKVAILLGLLLHELRCLDNTQMNRLVLCVVSACQSDAGEEIGRKRRLKRWVFDRLVA